MLPDPIRDRYDLVEEIGRGGMGRVWRARDQEGHPVAIKILKQTRLEPRHRERFVREACLAAKVRHAHVVSVLDVGVMKGRPYVAMELVEGLAFDEWVLQTQPSLEEVLQVVEQILSGIQAVHDAGILHRDIKPSNVLVCSTERGHTAKLIDFGISVGKDDDRLTAQGHLVGSLRWMSPERASAGEVDSRSDLFSVGLMLRFAITGETPYSGLSLVEVTHAVTAAILRPIRATWLPESVVRLIDRACAPRATDRHHSADAMREELRSVRHHLPSTVLEHAVGQPRRSSWHSLSNNSSGLRQLMVVSLLGIVLVVLTSGFLLRSLLSPKSAPIAIEEPV